MGPGIKSLTKLSKLFNNLHVCEMKNIKAIIFDLGGVIYNINYQKTIEEFIAIGLNKKKYIYSQEYQSEIFNQLEIGAITSEDFLLELKKNSSSQSISKIKKAWNCMLLDLPKERVKLLKKIKNKIPLFLLSNTNAIHIAEIKNKIGKKKYTDFYRIFNKVYFSYEIKKRKPDVDTFKFILKENNLSAKNVVFIDDSIQHINAAKIIGINTIFLDKNQDIMSLSLDKFL